MSHDSSAPSSDNTPWYRQFWPWFIIALPATTVAAGLATLAIAIHNADDVVADNWYRDGRAINRSNEAERRASQFGIRATLVPGDAGWSLSLHSTTPVPWPETLQVQLRHPTQATRDLQMQLPAAGDGRYLISGPISPGDWYVTLVADHWRLQQRVALGDTPVEIKAAL